MQTTAKPQSPNVVSQMAQYKAIQQAKQAKQARLAQQQAQALANATYVLVKPSNANIASQAQARVKPHYTAQQVQQVHANLAATLVLQLYPLVAQSGLAPAQQNMVQQALLKATYALQGAASIAPAQQAVQQILGQIQP